MNDRFSTLETAKLFRKEYRLSVLVENEIKKNPFEQFLLWFEDVKNAGFFEPNAMVLATIGTDNRPSQRVLLMKEFSFNGILFFTNYESRKGQDLLNNSAASILFYWPELERQVRIEGPVFKTTEEESDRYFAFRPRGAQVSGSVSPQSQPIKDREFLENIVEQANRDLSGQSISRPSNWGGYRMCPEYFEFWQGRENRLHDRLSYRLIEKDWAIVRLAP